MLFFKRNSRKLIRKLIRGVIRRNYSEKIIELVIIIDLIILFLELFFGVILCMCRNIWCVMCMQVHHHFCPLRVQKWENVENVKTSKNIIAIRVNTFISR